MRTVWKFNKMYKADPEEAYEEICSLETITPQSVVDLARDSDSVIHGDFEWDDEVAGEKYRVCQAQQMLRSFVLIKEPENNIPNDDGEEIEIVTDKPPDECHVKLRALHNTSAKNEYAPTVFFLENNDEYKLLLEKALRELDSFKARYAMISELEEVFNAINNL